MKDKEQLKCEEFKNISFWRINTWDYITEYKKYYDENRIVMGLGSDLDLKEYIDSDKEVTGDYKSYIENFLQIKKGDYIEWHLYNRENEYSENYLEVRKIIGKVTQELSEGYEFIKNIGHALPVQVIEKSIIKEYNTDYVEIQQINGWDKYWSSYFEGLFGYEQMKKAKRKKWYLSFKYFGLDNIDYDEKECKIKFKEFLIEKDKISILRKLKRFKKSDYVLVEFVSKKSNEVVESFRAIGTVAYEESKDKKSELILEVKGQEKVEDSRAIIGIYKQDMEEASINFINTKLRKSKNVILYGPPGTGKTYNIAKEIVKITNPHMIIEGADREDINEQVKELQIENRIKYCTFHQSYGYEEFIEGLRSDGKGNFVFEDGILKEIAIEALFNGLVYECKTELLDEIEDFEDEKENLTKEEIKVKEKDIKAKKKELVLKYINDSHRFDFYDCDQYVIIIDEINRGNISKIFGELITLLEEDKRLSKDNEMIIKLPYSKEDFILPPNLHLIGTMNTSDKSIAPIDIALRRRFKFIERMPDAELLKTVDGIDLAKMLKKINDRIEYLYDRDHMIGHAYFINLNSLEEISDTFSNKILPLLQEYFYEDWNKVGMVLGGIGESESDSYMIYKKKIKPKDLFKGTEAEDFPVSSKYYIKDEIGHQEIKSIYE